MTSITVERTGFGIVVAEAGDTEASALLDDLPPLRAARYLTATPALREALRTAEPAVVEAVLPHLDGTVVVPEAGLASERDGGGEAESTRLAQALGVSVIAPEGRFIACEGTLFSLGGDDWIAQSPRGVRVRAGRRYPAPAWQAQLPAALQGAAHIPAGLWITSGTEPRHAVRLAGIAVRERHLLVVVGSPSEPAPPRDRLLATLRSLPDETRSAVVLAGFGADSLPIDAVRDLAAELGQPLRVAHGVEVAGEPVRLDGDGEVPAAAFALESVCAPDGTVTLERWAAPPGLAAAGAAQYRLGETPRRRGRGADRWVVHVVAAGLVVRPASQPIADVDDLEAPAGSLGIFVQCDGAAQPAALTALLDPLRERLEQRSAVTIHPMDGAARRVVRDAYPGSWAPTEALAITADGRLVAATADASGDTERAPEPAHDAPTEIAGETDVERTDAPTFDAGSDADAADVVEATPVEPAPRTRRAARRAAARQEATREMPPARDEPQVERAPSTVEAVIGAEAAAAPPEESAGAASRRARDAHITNVPSTHEGAAAWYAAAVPGRALRAASDEATPHEQEARDAQPLARTAAPASLPQASPAKDGTAASATTSPAAAARDERPRRTEPAHGVAAAASATAPGVGTGSDALTRALQGSSAARMLGSTRGTDVPAAPIATTAPTSTEASAAAGERAVDAASVAAAAPIAATATSEQVAQSPAGDPLEHATPAPLVAAPRSTPAIEIPTDARSTADQRHRVRTALGARYDVASRTVSQLLAQQPGMRVATHDRSAMLTGLSLVRVFATEPHAEYDLDFHTCLAEGLSMLPTARSVVVRGIPATLHAAPGSLLRLRTPLVAAAADGPATGPSEALIWTTSGRRLDRVLHGSAGADDVVLPAGARLCVLGTAAGPAPRLLLAEEGADAEQALARLQAAADARGDLGVHTLDRWLGDLPLAA